MTHQSDRQPLTIMDRAPRWARVALSMGVLAAVSACGTAKAVPGEGSPTPSATVITKEPTPTPSETQSATSTTETLSPEDLISERVNADEFLVKHDQQERLAAGLTIIDDIVENGTYARYTQAEFTDGKTIEYYLPGNTTLGPDANFEDIVKQSLAIEQIVLAQLSNPDTDESAGPAGQEKAAKMVTSLYAFNPRFNSVADDMYETIDNIDASNGPSIFDNDDLFFTLDDESAKAKAKDVDSEGEMIHLIEGNVTEKDGKTYHEEYVYLPAPELGSNAGIWQKKYVGILE